MAKMWFVLFFAGFFISGILGSQNACFDMIPFSTSRYQDVDLPYEVTKKLKKYLIKKLAKLIISVDN